MNCEKKGAQNNCGVTGKPCNGTPDAPCQIKEIISMMDLNEKRESILAKATKIAETQELLHSSTFG